MLYYKPKFDMYLSYKGKNSKYYTYFLPERELLTHKELSKYTKCYNFNIDNFSLIEIPKNKTYIFFGIRTFSQNKRIFIEE